MAYVRSADLIYGYKGMNEAQQAFQEKQNLWKANLDTLQVEYKNSVQEFGKLVSSMDKDEKMQRQKMLVEEQKQLLTYSQAIEKKAREEDEKITQGILNQVNSLVEKYGKDHGYTVIFGTTQAGSLLYADDAIDITDDLLKELNGSYRKGIN
jgi:outer membrane protein